MALNAAKYQAWQGRRLPAWRAAGAVARATLLQLVRRKAYWILLAAGLLQFLVFAAVIYALTQTQLPPRMQDGMLQQFNFSPSSADPQESGYVQFIEMQSVVVVILLAFAGSVVVGADFRTGVLPFYLSRRIDRRHYVWGKLAAVAIVVWSLTLLPALGLFLEYGLLTTTADYWSTNWRVLPAICGYGLLLGTVLSVWIAAVSAYLQRIAPIVVTWSTLFLLLGRLAYSLRAATGDRRWLLLDPWRDLRLAGRLCFGHFANDSDRRLSVYAVALLATLTIIAAAALVRRVRAVEVVA